MRCDHSLHTHTFAGKEPGLVSEPEDDLLQVAALGHEDANRRRRTRGAEREQSPEQERVGNVELGRIELGRSAKARSAPQCATAITWPARPAS